MIIYMYCLAVFRFVLILSSLIYNLIIGMMQIDEKWIVNEGVLSKKVK